MCCCRLPCPGQPALNLAACASSATLQFWPPPPTQAYGAGITTEALLHGEVPLPECCGTLAQRLTEAEGRVVASAFEPSNRSEAYW